MSAIVLIGLDGKEKTRLPRIGEHALLSNAWIYHDGAWFGFGVGKLNGEAHFYQATPTGEQIRNQQNAAAKEAQ